MTFARLRDHLLTGDLADRPAAATVPVGAIYAAPDALRIDQSDGAAWQPWAVFASPEAVTDVSDALEALSDALDAHTGDTTDVHGIPDTSVLVTTTQLSTAVAAAVDALVGSAPALLDTLGELADKLGDDEDAAVALTSTVAGLSSAITALTTTVSGKLDRADLAAGTGITVTPTGTTRTVSVTRPSVLLNLGQTAADVPAGTPVGSLVFRKAS